MAEDSKEITLTPTITSLLKPTGDYLGAEIKNFVKSKVEKAKLSRQSENVQWHLDNLRNKATLNDSNLTYHQLDMFDEWVDGASKVDPQDKLLSEMWQNLLLDSKNCFNTEIILNKLKELSSGDAQTLIKVFSKESLNKEDRYRLKKLKSLELVEQNEFKLDCLKFIFLGLSGVAMISTATLSISPPDIFLQLPRLLQVLVSWLPVVFIGTIVYMLVNAAKSGKSALFKLWQLTWLGERLVNLNK